MSNKIFVGGLAWSTKADGLQDAFSKFGAISEAKVVTDRDTGRSRGFGFVTFENAQSCLEAIKNMDGQDLDGRKIRVDRAKERQPRTERRY